MQENNHNYKIKAMKRKFQFLLVAALGLSTFTATAQNQKDWINEAPESGVYGMSLNKAYELIHTKKLNTKSKPIVALLCGGIDAEHEAIAANMWVNKKEKVDGKDNDGNGYIDDVHGWNFLGGKDGATMEKIISEGNREFNRIGQKYTDLFFDGERYFKYVPDKVERVYVDAPADMAEYEYYINVLLKESSAARRNSLKGIYQAREYAFIFDKKLRAKFPDKSDFTMEEFASLWDKTGPQDALQNQAMSAMGLFFSNNQNITWKDCFEMYSTDKYQKYCERTGTQEDFYRKVCFDGRKEIVGDDIYNINDKVYGNNNLLTANAVSGTMAAGIIAGKRGVAGRNNPIAENAQIMALNVSAPGGEPYLKDMALAIRYAVDNGASVVVMPQQNTLYAPLGKGWMIDALRYAESKNVLVIVPTWELSVDLSQMIFLPNREMAADGKELTNLIVVSSSDKRGFPSLASNYGKKEVDLYAPGMEILSTYIGDTYQAGSSPYLSAATTAGVAALLRTYYPEMSVAQLRKIMIESCTSRKGAEVEKGIRVKGKNTQDMFLFEELCVSGGILNALNALETAGKK